MTLPATLALLLPPTVWVVDDNGGPGVNFTDIPPAIAAAADGDVLVVRSGIYTRFTLTGKGLRILGENSATTIVSLTPPPLMVSPTVIADIPATSIVYLERLTFFGSNASWNYANNRVEVTGSTTRVVFNDVVVVGSSPLTTPPYFFDGAVLVDAAEAHLFNCSIVGALGGGGPIPGAPGLDLKNGARVHVASSSITGGRGWSLGSIGTTFPPSPGGSGIKASSSAGAASWVWVTDSTVRGGEGGVNFVVNQGASGGAGILVNASHVRVSGYSSSLVRGGDEGSLLMGSYSPFGVGGPGIQSSGASTVDVHSVSVLGGNGSQPGPAITGPGITLNEPALPVLHLGGMLTLNGSATIQLSNGPAGAPFAIAIGTEPAYFGIPGPFLGEFLIGPLPLVPFLLGALSPGGAFGLTLPLVLPPSLAYSEFHLQGAALDSNGAWRLSNAVATVLRP